MNYNIIFEARKLMNNKTAYFQIFVSNLNPTEQLTIQGLLT